MPSHRSNGGPPIHLIALLAGARRDDLLRVAAQARLAAQVPRGEGERLRARFVLALIRVIGARPPAEAAGDDMRGAVTEHNVPIEARPACEGSVNA
ncbi:MAG: hypothetical protein M3065_11090 [Actinomycetota bacterium]|nr:hypothetical protein [Actinomycetota bacterium]